MGPSPIKLEIQPQILFSNKIILVRISAGISAKFHYVLNARCTYYEDFWIFFCFIFYILTLQS